MVTRGQGEKSKVFFFPFYKLPFHKAIRIMAVVVVAATMRELCEDPEDGTTPA